MVIERLQIATRFAQMELSTLRPGDWLNLEDDLDTFLCAGEVDRWPVDDSHGEWVWVTTGSVVAQPNRIGDLGLSTDAFRALQTETLAILTAVVSPPQTVEFGVELFWL